MILWKGGVRMADSGHWIRNIANQYALNAESLPGLPIVEIAGDCRVLIERHRGVVEYGTQRIRVRTEYGSVCVLGSHLQLKLMTRQQLIISGQIEAVQIQRRCR